MHIHCRLSVILALLIVATSLGTVPLLAALGRGDVQEALDRALRDVHMRKGMERGLEVSQHARAEDLEEAEEELQSVAREKREVRLRLALVNEAIEALREHGIDALNPESIASRVEEEREGFLSFIRYIRGRSLRLDPVASGLAPIVRRFLVASLGEWTDASLQARALERARFTLLGTLLDAEALGDLHRDLLSEHERLVTAYDEALSGVHAAAADIDVTAERLQEIERTVAEVQSQINRLQGELQRIDARLRERAERELVEKGLMDPATARERAQRDTSPHFLWPVHGRISAGFLDAAYRRFFGVPHRGIDIVVPHGTPIFAAADGIVFTARDGGARGYSYLLIGHRGGFATLYGHLSGFAVSEGQEVRVGQLVGTSGATPGTPGAGPMTTGAHFHLEIMKDGVHVNPVTVLP